jgi:hypothetical protein
VSSLDELRQLGGFVSDRKVEREITFSIDGEGPNTATIFVKKLSVGEHERIFLSPELDDERRSRMALMISECVSLGESGDEAIPFREAYTLHPDLANAMIKAIGSVNKRANVNPKA